MIESLLKNSTEGKTVSEGLEKLVSEGHLCRTVNLQLPDAWRCLPLSEIAPLKLPPCGEFVRCNTTPPSRSIMKYWSY
ncbi:hypothetical protein AGDE_09140 [Angomonas deanei]|uniref:Uncharacterized protein n=1 Tax=Angomonas deanei TaxID=59799 RepID=A0A7G2CKN2_9TRYP|nr:hypothetical protein AGDE_09140 [Angomonas deanei]CAD2219959.1 hypothetical protein, conserved [Angomonas deanei]|eukprot:EPY31265.1 hypothetical protein AGDE_09140 [Angomonas deanei]